jgi:uncharacterized Ntn-hydrolase superfamily protein
MLNMRIARTTIVLLIAGAALAPRAATLEERPWETGTFSILGYDPKTGEMGGAVQSRVFSVGNGVLWAEANVGVAATQAIVDVSYGPQSLDLLRLGVAPAALVIVKKNCGVWVHNDTVLRLQVDDNPEPIAELKRLVDKWNVRPPRGQIGCEGQ